MTTMKRIFLLCLVGWLGVCATAGAQTDSLALSADSAAAPVAHTLPTADTLVAADSAAAAPPKKYFWRAAGEVVGLNLGQWAFDRYVLRGFYSYISWKTIRQNFHHGFEWDNDHLSTNMFAHPYNGSLYFNAGRANGYNFWQSELFAIGGSAMWEMFMESEYPSTNDIIATPVGGAALGEVLFRASDYVLDDRSTGAERVGRELAAFVISPLRGLNRLINGQSWKRSATPGRQFGTPPVHLDFSLGLRALMYHDDGSRGRSGGVARLSLEYGDRYATRCKVPYEYFSLLVELNAIKTQPLLSRVEVVGRLLSKEVLQARRCRLSVGLYQHFDFFDSDTISTYSPKEWEPCVVPYKFGTPASVGGGAMFRYGDARRTFDAYVHANGVLLGGVLSDFYRYYHRNYNWGSGFAVKVGLTGSVCHDRLTFAFHNQYYRLFTRSNWDSVVDGAPSPSDEPMDVLGDESIASFNHLEGRVSYRFFKQLSLTWGLDWFYRHTCYDTYRWINMGGWSYGTSELFVSSHQVSTQLMLTYRF